MTRDLGMPTYPSDEVIAGIFDRCSNRNRWGDHDELGTLNFVSTAKRRGAAALVHEGVTVSIARPISTVASSVNRSPALHLMLSNGYRPWVALDYLGVAPHGFAVTHLDALSHVCFEGILYNGRAAADVLTPGGLTRGDVAAMREGIFTRGVLLDVAAAKGVDWLTPGEFVEARDLERAEELAGVVVDRGDVVILHVGLERREEVEGPEDPDYRAGVAPDVVEWLFEREVAVYSGDCMERLPCESERFPLPLHQIGLVSMGLVMLDCPRLSPLVDACHERERFEFLFMVAPLWLPRGTGSPVNPLCVF